MAGVNQTLMLALSMVVIAALIGAGGLGLTVYVALGRLDIGSAVDWWNWNCNFSNYIR